MEKLIVCCLLIASLASLQAHEDYFVMTPGACILNHNTIVRRRVTREWCEDECLDDPTCKSYEYRADRRVCHTSTKSSADVELLRNPCHVTGYDLYDRVDPHDGDGDHHPDECPGGYGNIWLDITGPPHHIPPEWMYHHHELPDSHCKVQGVLRLEPPAGYTAVRLEMVLDGPYGKTVFDIADLPNTQGPDGQCDEGAEVYGTGNHNRFTVCSGSGGYAAEVDEALRTGDFTVHLGPNKVAWSNHWDKTGELSVNLFDMETPIWFGVNHPADRDDLHWGDGLCSVCVIWYTDWDALPDLPSL